jgi:hypothetical protein
MNRRKKLNNKLKKKAKRTNAKLNPVKKRVYISKAERAAMADETPQTEALSSDD